MITDNIVSNVRARASYPLRLICFLTLLLSAASGYAQINYAGRDFWIAQGYKSSILASGDPVICVASEYYATVKFNYTNPGSTQTYNVIPGEILYVKPDNAAFSGTAVEQIENNSLNISSDSNITVTLIENQQFLDDATQILPSDNQRPVDSFMLFSISRAAEFSGIFTYALVSRCDSTVLEITPVCNTLTHFAQVPYTIVLNRGETYQIGTKAIVDPSGLDNDLSGTGIKLVHSRIGNPINVFCGYWSTISVMKEHKNVGNIPAPYKDVLLEQLLPVNWWDTVYPIVPVYNHYDLLYRVISAKDSNHIYFDRTLITTLNKGEIFDTVFTGAVVVSSDFPVAVTEYPLAEEEDDIPDNGDGDMLWNMSISQGIREGYFRPLTYAGNTGVNVTPPQYILTLVSKTADIAGITLNGGSVSGYFQNFPLDVDWQYAYVPLDTATTSHLISSNKIIAYVTRQYWRSGHSFNVSDLVLNNFDRVDTVNKCENEGMILTAGTADNYLWSTGGQSKEIYVSDTGRYWVKHTYNCGPDTVTHHYFVRERKKPSYSITPDTVTCINNSLQLQANVALFPGSFNIIWEPSAYLDNNAIINPIMYAGGKDISYTVTIAPLDTALCAAVDTVHVTVLQGFTVFNRDTLLCKGETILIEALGDERYSYTWSPADGVLNVLDLNTALNPEFTTQYTVTASYPGCRDSSYSFKVDIAEYHIAIELGRDTALCEDEYFLLRTGYPGTRWSTGEVAGAIIVRNAGTFIATVEDSCHNLYTDSIHVAAKNCKILGDCFVVFPSAFSPNNDGRNDSYRPVVYGIPDNYYLAVYNRWGDIVYETHDPAKGWDGSYKGTPADAATYLYRCSVKCPKGNLILEKGDIHLIR